MSGVDTRELIEVGMVTMMIAVMAVAMAIVGAAVIGVAVGVTER
jgi:hypothetical protein